MRQRKRQIGGGDQNDRTTLPRRAWENRHRPAADGQNRFLVHGPRHGPRHLALEAPDRSPPSLAQRLKRRQIGLLPGRQQVQAPRRMPPTPQKRHRIGNGARQKAQIIQLQNLVELQRSVVARGCGAMGMHHARARREHRRPSLLPAPHAQVQVLHIGRLINRIQTIQLPQLRGVEQRTAPAAIQHVAQILAFDGRVAGHGEVGRRAGFKWRHHGLSGLLPADAFGKENLGRGAKQIRHFFEGPQQFLKEAVFHHHVVVQ